MRETRRKVWHRAAYMAAVLCALAMLAGAWGVQVAERQAAPTCQSNLKSLAGSLLQYAQDSDDRLPPAGSWHPAVLPYARTDAIFWCPSVKHEPFRGGTTLVEPDYGYNVGLSCRRCAETADPDRTVALFESTAGGLNPADVGTSLPVPPRHPGFYPVAYLDGHVKAVQEPECQVRPVPDAAGNAATGRP